MFVGIRTKLSLLTFLLVTAVITVSSALVIGIMDRSLLGELLKRGLSLSRGAANAAGYSMLIRDRLSLDNLVAKIQERQGDILFVAVVEQEGAIAAHSELGRRGERFAAGSGRAISREGDGAVVTRVEQPGRVLYQFQVPIVFAERQIGQFYLGIDAASLTATQAAARSKVAIMAAVVLGLSVAGACLIARIFTRPIKQLNQGVSQLKSGRYLGAIPVAQRDELGELTGNFNAMASVIVSQQDKLAEYARDMEESYLATVKILATSIDARDDYTMQHSTRVAALSLLVAREMGLTGEEQRELEVAALVHDLGKIRIPDHILKKPEPLDVEEYHRVKRHPRDGAEILGHSPALRRFIPAVLHHHEWYNGGGYPEGLRRDAIPLFAAIIALADTYDAMTSSRPYRAALPAGVAIEEILRCRGTQFDPRLTDHFVAALKVPSPPPALTVLEMPFLQAELEVRV